jgi:hypothetical protein
VVIISFEDYKKMIKPKKDLLSFLQDSPLSAIDLDLTRNKDYPRDVEI